MLLLPWAVVIWQFRLWRPAHGSTCWALVELFGADQHLELLELVLHRPPSQVLALSLPLPAFISGLLRLNKSAQRRLQPGRPVIRGCRVGPGNHVVIIALPLVEHSTDSASDRGVSGVLYSREGGNATLPCDRVRGPNCSSVSWNSSERGIPRTKIWPDSPPDRAERLSLLPDCSLHITNVTTKDAGRYRCRNHQSGRDVLLILHVLAGVLYSRDGGNATLPCDGVRGPNCSSVSWHSDDDGWRIFLKKIWPDSPPDRAERLSLLPDCSLHITNVTTEDAGLYRCWNHQSGRSGDLHLRVLAGVLYSRDGGNATLPCDVVRGPNCSSVSWYSDEDWWGIFQMKIWPDSPPDRAERLSLLPDCSLHITNVTTEDAGRYRCRNHQSGRSEDLLLHVLAGRSSVTALK
ncbi:hypothetical protein ACEWY4_002428 [Coilia grayii]|uniref:Ig-like domain-containing protein n=1 Tax=Coilia grayii TaxID=363190 RepID=A0ABD1KNH0_9TELE